MQLVGLMLVRNESWVLNCTLRGALKWCDSVVVMDHASTDATLDNINEISNEAGKGRVYIYHWPDGSKWDEMLQRQRLLEMGRSVGGTHFGLIDADEIVTANNLGGIRGWVEQLNPGGVLDLPMIPVWGDLDHYRDDQSVWSKANLSTAFADAPGMGWAPRGSEQYQHHNRVPHNSKGRVIPAAALTYLGGGVMHLQWASWKRVVAKHRRYKILERSRYPNYQVKDIDDKYNLAVSEQHPKRSAIPPVWWGDYHKSDIKLDSPIWFDEDSRRMINEKGVEYFNGLNLFGGVDEQDNH